MLEMFERLINEHGSSAILRERLELISDRYTLLEGQLAASRQENSALNDQIGTLRKDLELAQEEIERLVGERNAHALQNAGPQLDDGKISILKLMFQANQPLNISALSRAVRIDENLIEYHLDRLSEIDLITTGPLYINEPLTYVLSKSGRKYVVEHVEI